MNRENDDKWLDELLEKTIDSSGVQFDAQKWKNKFPDELQMLKSRANKTAEQRLNVFSNPAVKIAVAAVIILVIGLFIYKLRLEDTINKTPKVRDVAKSPAEILTLRSLKIAYYNGGIEAVETQCDSAIENLSLKSDKITINELLAEINGT